MKIVFLNPTSQLGGAENILINVLNALRDKKPHWKCYLIVASDGPLVDKARQMGVFTEIIPFPQDFALLGDFSDRPGWPKFWRFISNLFSILVISPAIFSYSRKLRKILSQQTPNLIHSNALKTHLLGLWCRTKRTPIIWHMHDFISLHPVIKWALKIYLKHCSAVLAISQKVLDDFKLYCGTPINQYVLYNTVDLNKFTQEAKKLNLDMLSGLNPCHARILRIGLIATMAFWKGHEIFLEAIALLPKDLPLRAYVIGGPIYETKNSQRTIEELHSIADRLNILDRVGFTGYVQDVPAAMRALDIVVHASIQPEPFGLVIVEAMACGKPVIASKAGGPEEIIVDGENGLFHTPGDAKSLANNIVRLATNPELRKKLGENGRKTVEEKFNSAHLAECIIPIYEAVLASKERYA